MNIGFRRATLALTTTVVLLSACTTLDPYTREEQTARAQRNALIGAAAGAASLSAGASSAGASAASWAASSAAACFVATFALRPATNKAVPREQAPGPRPQGQAKSATGWGGTHHTGAHLEKVGSSQASKYFCMYFPPV